MDVSQKIAGQVFDLSSLSEAVRLFLYFLDAGGTCGRDVADENKSNTEYTRTT